MRNQAMTIPGMGRWNGVALVVAGLASRIPQVRIGRYIREVMLLVGVLGSMSILTVGTIVWVACTVAQAVGGAN